MKVPYEELQRQLEQCQKTNAELRGHILRIGYAAQSRGLDTLGYDLAEAVLQATLYAK